MRGAETIQIDMRRHVSGIKTIKDTNITEIKLEPIEPETKIEELFEPTPTAKHEAGHTLVGNKRNVGIAGVDIAPSGNALGKTYPDRFDAPTAAAGFATGTGGHGHDQFITEEIHGQSFGQAAMIASIIIMSNQKAFMALARALDTQKSLSRGDIYSIVDKAEKEEDVKDTMYQVIKKTKDGKEEREIVVLPRDQTTINISLPQSADIFVASENKKELSLAR